MLSEAQIEFYREQGYLLLENAIPPETLTALRDKIDEFLEASRAVESSNSVYDLDASHSAAAPRVRRLKDPYLRDPLFRAVCESDAILDPVAQLLGGTVRFDHSKLNFKHPGVDFYFFQMLILIIIEIGPSS